MKKDRATVSDEQREQQLIAEQISRAAVDDDGKTSGDSSTPPVEEGLKRDETSEKVVLSFSAKPIASSGSAAVVVSTGVKINPLKAVVNPLKASNPLKRPNNNNIFKSSTSSSTTISESGVNEKKRPAPMSAAERLIIEEQERKRRRMDRDNMA